MRSYLEILEDLEDGKLPDYQEVRLAALMASYMLNFAERSITKLTNFGTDGQKTDLTSTLAIKEYESRFKSRQLSPDTYLGSWHPDSPGRQEARKLHKKVFDNILKKIEDDKK